MNADPQDWEVQSPEINELATALAKAQLAIAEPVKNRTGSIKTRKGYTYEYKYADLATVLKAVRDAFAPHGLSIVQSLWGNLVVTTIAHSSGQWIRSWTRAARPEDGTPQAFGSQITYLRRYQVLSLAGIASEDDDGAIASEQPPAKSYEPWESRVGPIAKGSDSIDLRELNADRLKKYYEWYQKSTDGPLDKEHTHWVVERVVELEGE